MLGGVFQREAPLEHRESVWSQFDTNAARASSTWSGATVTAQSSMQLLAVYGSVTLITDQISTLPIDTFRDPVEVPKPAWLLQPTVDLSFVAWCSQVLISLLLAGNAYIAVTRDGSGAIIEAIPLDPERVKPYRENGRLKYRVNGVAYPGEIVHIPGRMLPGSDVGLSPIEYARQTIGLGVDALRYGGEFFSGEGLMPGVIEMPRPAQPGIMEETGRMWQRKRKSGGRGLPGVLQDGATWKPTGVTNEQAQFLATRKFTAAEIAGQMFLLDPSDLGIPVEGTSLTYANLEQRNARRVQVTLLPWIIRIEEAISELLVTSKLKFNVNGLLRGDTLSRFQAYQIGADIGVLTVDEMRGLENFSPLSADDRKDSRSWQLVGLPALVSDGLMTVNEARAQLGLPPIPGGDVPRDPAAEMASGGFQ
jgi:HK97 family phage portal protein